MFNANKCCTFAGKITKVTRCAPSEEAYHVTASCVVPKGPSLLPPEKRKRPDLVRTPKNHQQGLGSIANVAQVQMIKEF